MIDTVRACAQFGARRHKVSEIAIWWRHKAAGPSHDVITAKQVPPPFKADVIAKMPRSMQRGQCPFGGLDLVLIGKAVIRCKRGIDPFAPTCKPAVSQLCHDSATARVAVAKGIDRRTGSVGQWCRVG